MAHVEDSEERSIL
jgi:hypothetical protein